MFGALGRAALGVPVAVLMGQLIEFIWPFFQPFVGPESSFLYRLFASTADNATLVMLAALAAAVLAASVAESNAGV